jgi:predicted ferric reductase
MYVALGLASLHQANGAEIAGQPWWADYWVALHMTVIGGLVVFRAGRPILTCAKHQFRIDRIVTESDDVTSVYLTGRQLDRFTFRSGQYANVVFLSKGRRSPHPFSFSAAPNGRYLRVSVKAAGDFTDRIRELTPGTLALLEGPLGAFTAAEPRDKYLNGGWWDWHHADSRVDGITGCLRPRHRAAVLGQDRQRSGVCF